MYVMLLELAHDFYYMFHNLLFLFVSTQDLQEKIFPTRLLGDYQIVTSKKYAA